MLQTGKNDNAMISFLARYLNDNFKPGDKCYQFCLSVTS